MPSDPSDARPARRVAISGSTGVIGSELVPRLRREGWTVSRLVRSAAKVGPGDVLWNPEGGQVDAAALEGVDAVVHLAGENVGVRWTEEARRRIRRSRSEGTRALTEALAGLARKPEVLVSASAVGLYGDRGDEVLTEESARGHDFLADVVSDWEAATEPAEAAGIRTVRLRFGVVLSAKGGALAKMLPPFRLGAGGKMGSGRQWMAWVGMEDAVEATVRALEDASMRGAYNVVSPRAATNADFTRALGSVLGRPTFATVPEIALKLLFGEMAETTILASQRVEPRRLVEAGFPFRHPELRDALRAALAAG